MFVTNSKEKSVCSQDTERVVQPSEFIHAFSRSLQGSEWQQNDKLLDLSRPIQAIPGQY